MSDTAEKIAKILEDPESIKMISEIAESFMSGSSGSETSMEAVSVSDENIPETHIEIKDDKIDSQEKSEDMQIASLMPKDLSSLKLLEDILGKGDIENSIKLISALKPYMSKRRRDSADSVLKWLKALKLLRKSNLSEISRLFNLIQ